jgi:beta-glucosidase
LVTLHHFSNPLWFEDRGGWLQAQAPERFLSYTRYVADGLRDLVFDWVTINEANIYLVFGYIFGEWPPGRNTVAGYLRGGRSMVQAHLLAYDELHRAEPSVSSASVLVGAAHHVRIFDPQRDRLVERALSRIYDRVFQDIFIAGMTDGSRLFPLGLGVGGTHRAADFLGLNYYSRDMIAFRWNPGSLFGEQRVRKGAEVSELGWEIYPEGLYRSARRYYERYRLPVFITENGICDRSDRRRPRYILEHLQQVKKLIDDGIDVQRYYHWTLTDNFEWAEGESARFGLIELDYESQKRSIRRSGELYAELCRHRRADAALLAKYL